MAKHAHKGGFAGLLVPEFLGHLVIEKAKVIGIYALDPAAEIMHGKIPEHGNRPALKRLETDQGKVRVLRARFTGDIIPVATRMHVGAHSGVAKRIVGDAVGAPDPAAQGRVFIGIKDSCPHLCRFQIFLRPINGFHDLALE